MQAIFHSHVKIDYVGGIICRPIQFDCNGRYMGDLCWSPEIRSQLDSSVLAVCKITLENKTNEGDSSFNELMNIFCYLFLLIFQMMW